MVGHRPQLNLCKPEANLKRGCGYPTRALNRGWWAYDPTAVNSSPAVLANHLYVEFMSRVPSDNSHVLSCITRHKKMTQVHTCVRVQSHYSTPLLSTHSLAFNAATGRCAQCCKTTYWESWERFGVYLLERTLFIRVHGLL
jgi:hypothetical protein